VRSLYICLTLSVKFKSVLNIPYKARHRTISHSYKTYQCDIINQMELDKAHSHFPELIALAEVDSTNKELLRRLGPESPEFFAVTAASQLGGLGRLSRNWVTEPGKSMALSMLLRPKTSAAANWITIMAGLALRQVVVDLGVAASIKWPNDILVDGRKLAGILAELSGPNAVILGMGLNLQPQQGAPETATSLSELGAEVSIDHLISLVATAIKSYWELLNENPTEAIARFQTELATACSTLGTEVRAELPGGRNLYGVARAIDAEGRLVIECPEPVALAAADVWHLRN